jgi:hypothetical protein
MTRSRISFYLALSGILFGFSGCFFWDAKPLDVQTVDNDKVAVRWFITSGLSSVHNHVEIETRGGWEQLLETDGNAYHIYNVLLNRDTIVVQIVPGTMVYQMQSYYWGTTLRLDSSITEAQYEVKFRNGIDLQK